MEADYDFVGCGSGKGYTVNVLWNKVSLCNICTFSSSETPVVAIVKKELKIKQKVLQFCGLIFAKSGGNFNYFDSNNNNNSGEKKIKKKESEGEEKACRIGL